MIIIIVIIGIVIIIIIIIISYFLLVLVLIPLAESLPSGLVVSSEYYQCCYYHNYHSNHCYYQHYYCYYNCCIIIAIVININYCYCVCFCYRYCYNWVAPGKPAPSDYFVAIFQVAPNRLKFGMSTLFVLKKCLLKNCVKFNPPPSPPSMSVSKQHRISIFEGQNTLHVSFTQLEGDLGVCGGGGGSRRAGSERSRMCLKPCFPTRGRKNTGRFFNTKRVDMPNFSRFGVTWKIAMN